jgi:hypothetical protein
MTTPDPTAKTGIWPRAVESITDVKPADSIRASI